MGTPIPSSKNLIKYCVLICSNLNLNFRIVGDNIDHTVNARIQSKESKNQSLHWTHQYAVLGRANKSSLDNTMPQKEIKEIQLVELLPTREVQLRLKNRWAILVSRVVCKYIHPFKYLQNVVLYHIPHSYSKEMTEKSEIVSFKIFAVHVCNPMTLLRISENVQKI